MEVAPQYWIWHPLTDAAQARRRLEGLVSLVAAVLAREPEAKLVDLRSMLADVERILPQAPPAHRPALLLLHILFNLHVSLELRTPGFAEFLEKHAGEAGTAGIEAVVVATLLDATTNWSVEAHRAALDSYFTERVRPKGLHAPRLVEAAMCLTLAERYRMAQDVPNAKEMVGMAVETYPGHPGVLRLEAEFDGEAPIRWREILLPKQENATSSNKLRGC